MQLASNGPYGPRHRIRQGVQTQQHEDLQTEHRLSDFGEFGESRLKVQFSPSGCIVFATTTTGTMRPLRLWHFFFQLHVDCRRL